MRESQDNFAVILDHVGDGVTVQDRTGSLIYANAAAARALGFATPAELLATPLSEVVGRFAIFDDDGNPFPLDHLPGRRALAGEAEPAVAVGFRVLASGEERWSAIRASPVVDADGAVQFVVNVWQDVTAQKRAEAAQRFLAEAGEALGASLDVEATLTNIAHLAVPRLADWCAVHLVRDDGAVSQLAVAHVDPERVAWARELQERYPTDPESTRGVPGVVRSGRPELIPEVSDEMLAAAARDPEHLEILRRVGLTSGLIAPMIAREAVLGTITFVAAESGRRYDAGDLELAQELARRAALAVENARLFDAERGARVQAEEAQARFQDLFEGAPDAILVIDAGGRFIEANTAACDLLGYALDELLALEMRDIAADQVAGGAGFDQTAEARAETEVRRKDGTLTPVEIWARRLDLSTGPIGISVVRDISERRASDLVREEVLTAISHDLRNPLNSIKLHAQSLRRSIQRGRMPDAERLDDGLAAIDTMGTRVATLLDDIVEIARSRGGEGLPYAPEPTDLVALAHRCVEETRTVATGEIRVAASAPAIVGLWDPRGMERVVLNLLTNAAKYSPHGGEVLVRIDQSDVAGAPWAILEVHDQGIGIPAPDLARIFERYRRGRNVGQISGTGLGLTGARQIVERHGGAIEIASEEGRGTHVAVRLPLQLSPAEVVTPTNR